MTDLGIGRAVCGQAERQLDQLYALANPKTKETIRQLRKCLPVLERVVEQICPTALVDGADGLEITAGVSLPVTPGRTYIFITTSGDVLLTNVEVLPWPDATKLAQLRAEEKWRSKVWTEIYEAVLRKDARIAVAGIDALVEPQQSAVMEQQISEVLRKGFYPAVLALVSKRRIGEIIRAAGSVAVLMLPPSLDRHA
jgi:hypothetical protein